MRLIVNEQSIETTERLCVSELLALLSYQPESVAVAVNGQFVARRDWDKLRLEPADELDVVVPMQGG